MPQVETYFYENDNYLGYLRTTDFTHVSMVFVCPNCGHAWGRRNVVLDCKQTDYSVDARPCQEHGNSRMISPFDPIDSLPEAVMAREICYGGQEWLTQTGGGDNA